MYTIQQESPSAAPVSAGSLRTQAHSLEAKWRFGGALSDFLGRTGRQLGLVAALMLAAMTVQAQGVEDGYAPVVLNGVGDPGWVFASAMQADGKALIGGSFIKVNGQLCTFLCRLNADGSIDPMFVKPNPNGSVHSILVQADGKILVGGGFDQLGGHTRHGVARLYSDGSVDTSFADPQLSAGGGISFSVANALAVQADGRILVAGSFDSVGGETRRAVARLNSNGTLDASFVDPDVPNTVNTVALQPDGKLLIGGDFVVIHGQTHPSVARLNPDGSTDTQFAVTSISGRTDVLALRADGKIMIGGDFHFSGGQPYNYLARLNADGTVDTSFADLQASSEVSSMAWQADGKLLVGGIFTQIGGQPRSRVARLEVDGSIDSSFKPTEVTGAYPNFGVSTLLPQTDGKVIIGGLFDTISGQNRLARLNADGSVDKTISPHGDQEWSYGAVPITALQPDGKMLIVEYFDTNDGRKYHITRLNPDGSPDASFVDAAPNRMVEALVVQRDGKVLVSGRFDTIAGQATPQLVRLNSDGSLDTSFSFDAVGWPQKMVIQPDGRILVFGYKLFSIEGQGVGLLARLNPDGSLDTSFTPEWIGSFTGGGLEFETGLLLQADGKIVIAGPLTDVGGVSRRRLARLNSDGSLDTGFQPVVDLGSSYSIALLPDGKLLTYGADGLRRLNADGSVDASFTGLNSSMHLDSYVVQTDGGIVVAFRDEGAPMDWLQRLNPNGTPDTGFTQVIADGRVMSLSILPGGTLLLGGDFNYVDGVERKHLARVAMPVAATQTLEVSGSTVTWQRSSASPALRTAPILYYSTGGAFMPLGPMTRVFDTWQHTGAPLPLDSFYYLRAEGQVGSIQGSYQGDGLIHSTRQAYNAEILFTNGFE